MSKAGTNAPAVTPRILVFFDYACPFCYLDWPRFKRLRAAHGAELVLVPFELRPQLPGPSVPIDQIGPAHSERVEEHMRRMAAAERIGFVLPAFMPNTHFALAMGEYARDLGPVVHERVHEALFAAYNAEARDIGRVEVISDIAREVGIDATDVVGAIESGRYDERLHEFYHLGLSMGVVATPAALICNELFIGTRPLAVLEQALRGCLVDAANASGVPGGVIEGRAGGGEIGGTDRTVSGHRDEGAPPTIDS
jgi:predicted DsbA family dithiol-disulfide isomerase